MTVACQPQCLANTCSCHCSGVRALAGSVTLKADWAWVLWVAVVATTGSAFTGKTIQAPLRIWSSSGPVYFLFFIQMGFIWATGTADWTTVAVVAVYCSTVSQMLVFLVVWVVWVVWVLWVAVAAWDHVWFPAVGI